MRTALTQYNTLDRRAAAMARLSLLVIDTDMVVVVASFSPQVAILTEGCSPVLKSKR